MFNITRKYGKGFIVYPKLMQKFQLSPYEILIISVIIDESENGCGFYAHGHRELASALNTSTQTVAFNLNNLIEKGLIYVDNNKGESRHNKKTKAYFINKNKVKSFLVKATKDETQNQKNTNEASQDNVTHTQSMDDEALDISDNTPNISELSDHSANQCNIETTYNSIEKELDWPEFIWKKMDEMSPKPEKNIEAKKKYNRILEQKTFKPEVIWLSWKKRLDDAGYEKQYQPQLIKWFEPTTPKNCYKLSDGINKTLENKIESTNTQDEYLQNILDTFFDSHEKMLEFYDSFLDSNPERASAIRRNDLSEDNLEVVFRCILKPYIDYISKEISNKEYF